MRLEFDTAADALYVVVSEAPTDHSRFLDRSRVLDLDRDGCVVGIEFLHATTGVNLDGIPYHDQIAGLIWDECDVVAVVGPKPRPQTCR